jgi:hypothetical protein
MIGRILQIDTSAVSYHARRYLSHADRAGLQGRPPILEATRANEVIAKILEAYARGVPWTVGDVARYILTQWNLSIEKNTLHHLLKRDGRTKSCNGIPMEQNCLELTSQQVHAHIVRLIETVDGIPAHCVFNMDETGHQEWADRQQKTCIVPLSHEAAHVYFPVSRRGKRVTLIACIAQDGSFLRLTIIIPRKTVDDDLFLTELTSEKVTVVLQPNGFIDTALFDAWLLGTFLPELQQRHQSSDYNGPAVLILDNSTAPSSETFASLCQQNRVLPFYLRHTLPISCKLSTCRCSELRNACSREQIEWKRYTCSPAISQASSVRSCPPPLH